MSLNNNARALAPEVAERLAKLLGMLGSEHPGERAAAALKADQLVKREGLSWPDVIQPVQLVTIEPEPEEREPDDWLAMVRSCAARSWMLSDKERDFIRTMTRWRGEPTMRQMDWLEAIFDRVGGGR